MRAQVRGRHRLGTPGLVHCTGYLAVRLALEGHRRNWLSTLLVPAKHSLAGLRRHAIRAARERAWIPATA